MDFNDLIEKIKNKLPGRKDREEGVIEPVPNEDDNLLDEQEFEDANQKTKIEVIKEQVAGKLDLIKSKFSKQKDSDQEDDLPLEDDDDYDFDRDDEDEASESEGTSELSLEEIEKKEKPPLSKGSLAIRIIIVIALLYEGVSMFLEEDKPVVSKEVPAHLRKKKKLRPKSVKKEIEKNIVKENIEVNKPESDVADQVVPNPVESYSNELDENRQENLETSVPKKDSSSELTDSSDEEAVDLTETIGIKVEDKAYERPVLEDEVASGKLGETKKSESIIDQVQKIRNKVRENIDKSIPYAVAPDYLKKGRGLVYNCLGRHYACVNRINYFQCRANQKWSKQSGAKKECVIVDVYASRDDCQVAQTVKINAAKLVQNCF